MKRRGISALLCSISVAALLVTVAGCKEKPKFAGSCATVVTHSYTTSKSHQCRDEFRKTNLNGCESNGGKLSDKPCDLTDAIGGCKGPWSTSWDYKDSQLDLQALSEICTKGGDQYILPNDAGVVVPKTKAELNAADAKSMIPKHGAKAKINLAGIAALSKKPLSAPTGSVNLEGYKGGYLTLHAEDLGDVEHLKPLSYRIKQSQKPGVCSRTLNNRMLPTDSGLELYGCAEYPVLVVIQVTKFENPTSSGTTKTPDGKQQTTWVNRGKVTGNVLFYRLTDQKYLGGFPFSTQNGPIDPNTTMEKLKSELWDGYQMEINVGIDKKAVGLLKESLVVE